MKYLSTLLVWEKRRLKLSSEIYSSRKHNHGYNIEIIERMYMMPKNLNCIVTKQRHRVTVMGKGEKIPKTVNLMIKLINGTKKMVY